MGFETIYPRERQIIFHEGFQSEFNTRRFGGVPTDVTYENGIATFNGSSSYIQYNVMPVQTIGLVKGTIRIVLTHTDTNGSQDWVVDFDDGLCYVDLQSGSVFRSSGDVYVNGVLGNSYTMGKKFEVIITGFNIQGNYFRIGSQYNNTQWFEGNIELFRTYNYEMTAEEVANLAGI